MGVKLVKLDLVYFINSSFVWSLVVNFYLFWGKKLWFVFYEVIFWCKIVMWFIKISSLMFLLKIDECDKCYYY